MASEPKGARRRDGLRMASNAISATNAVLTLAQTGAENAMAADAFTSGAL